VALKDIFKRKPNRFLQMLQNQASVMLKGIEALDEYMKEQDPVYAKQIAELEREADELRRVLIDDLNRTFVTPFDREDIFALSLTIGDILDYGFTTVDEMVILHVKTNDYLRQMVSLLLEAAHEIYRGVGYLEQRPNIAVDHAMRAKGLENRVESVYREAIAALFQGPQDLDHVVEMLKLREIYRHLSNAADRGDAAANVLSNIVVKMR
jgi:predicted phosphate transport protein (TIGR00153 family)